MATVSLCYSSLNFLDYLEKVESIKFTHNSSCSDSLQLELQENHSRMAHKCLNHIYVGVVARFLELLFQRVRYRRTLQIWIARTLSRPNLKKNYLNEEVIPVPLFGRNQQTQPELILNRLSKKINSFLFLNEFFKPSMGYLFPEKLLKCQLGLYWK